MGDQPMGFYVPPGNAAQGSAMGDQVPSFQVPHGNSAQGSAYPPQYSAEEEVPVFTGGGKY